MEYIFLYGYIRNTPSDTEVSAEHQLRGTGVPDQWTRTYRTMQNSVGQRNQGGETGLLVGLYLPLVGGRTEAGV